MPTEGPETPQTPRLVLVGAGHTHALVLERWADKGSPSARLRLVTDRAEVAYSGMLPGLVAGEYRRDEVLIDVEGLARRAGAELIVERVLRIDAGSRRLVLESGRTIEYDIASLDVGSIPSGLDDPAIRAGVVSGRDHTELDARLGGLDMPDSPDASAPLDTSDPPDTSDSPDPPASPDSMGRNGARVGNGPPPAVVVVGGGAAGVELAACVRARLPRASVTLVEAEGRLMADHSGSVSTRVLQALEKRAVDVRTGATVTTIEGVSETREGAAADDIAASTHTGTGREPRRPRRSSVRLGSGERLPSDLTVWVAGAAAPPLLARSSLPTDGRGFVRVSEALQVVGHDDLFAVGDCASVEGHDLARAGVHAVAQAPVLARNLTAAVDGWTPSGGSRAEELERFAPQSDLLILLNLGDGTALGTKWGLVAEGRWVRWVKDVIDRRFLRRLRL